MSSDSPALKKVKRTGAIVYSDVDMSKLTFDSTPQGANEIKHSSVKYDGLRLTFQLEDGNGSLRAPFGIDDGSKFSSKPSIKLELHEAQRAFFQDTLEPKIKAAAVENKATWFAAIKPLPDDSTVLSSFTSRVSQDEGANFPPSIKLNMILNDGDSRNVNIRKTRRLENGKIVTPTPASPDDVVRGCGVIPVIRTAGGVWISVNAKKKSFEYGLVFEVSEMLVIEGTTGSSSINLSGVEVVDEENTGDGGDFMHDGDGDVLSP